MIDLPRNTAWLYDFDNGNDIIDDIDFYLEYAKSQKGDVLELGCGTGRVSLALAHHGINVTGLDLSSDMLKIFKAKLDTDPQPEGKVHIVHGNMAKFCLNKKFELVIAPFRAFQALTKDDDALSALHCIMQHLTDQGIFILNVFMPHANLDEKWCYKEYIEWERYNSNLGLKVVKKNRGDRIDVERQIIYPHITYEIISKYGEKERWSDELPLKYYYEEQLAQLVKSSGYQILERYGWYDKQPIAQARREIIFVCALRTKREKP